MHQRVVIYTVFRSVSTETSSGPIQHLRQTVEDRGDVVVGTFVDYGPEVQLRQRNVGWKNVLANLDSVDQVAVRSAGDLPGKTVKDLLRLLATLRDRGVGLLVVTEGIETSAGSAFALMDIIRAYRSAKLSQAIRRGQAKAVQSGKVIGRPEVPTGIRQRIQAYLAAGGGIRPTARRFHVSPGSVINIRRAMAEIDAEAA